MVERGTIRPSKPIYDRLNERRAEQRLTWDEFFEEMLEEGGEADGESRIAAGKAEQLDRIESRLETVSNTLSGIKDQLTSLQNAVETAMGRRP